MSPQFYDLSDPSPTWERIAKAAIALIVAVAVLWFVARPVLGGSGGGAPASNMLWTTTTTTTTSMPIPHDESAAATTIPRSARSAGSGSEQPGGPDGETTLPASYDDVRASAATLLPSEPAPGGPIPALVPTDGANVQPAPVDTLPDGSAAPVLAVFDVDQVTLSGAVPSESAVERLELLAITSSKSGAPVLSLLSVDPSVPANVGVRVVELDSVRFPDGSAAVTAEHGRELDRVAVVMRALPHVTVDVVGHADQRGSESANYQLSVARATAVVDHLVAAGVEPHRLSARAVGESDLLSLDDDAAALALNRRTEFVFHGVLLG